VVHQVENVEGTSKSEWKNKTFRHTRVWSLDRPVFQQVMFTVPRTWQPENIVFFGEGTSWISRLFPLILRNEVNVVE